MTAAATKAIADLITLLDVAPLDVDLYRGARHPGAKGRVFGGQVIGQGLAAGARSAPEGKYAHSLHAYFMRPGDDDLPIDYRVLRDFDGKSFSTRRIVALQNDTPILNMTASFQRPEDGLSHDVPMPDVPMPASLETNNTGGETSMIARFLKRFEAFDFRPIPPFYDFDNTPQLGPSGFWFRLAGIAPENPMIRSAILAYLSDFGLLTTAALAHGINPLGGNLQVASLDHALWLHETPAFDDWLLYSTQSPWAGHGRGLTRGTFHTAAGQHIASVAQEGLIRQIVPKAQRPHP